MIKVQVFDPALCCSSGVCGVDVDQALVTFAADVEWLKSRGVTVERFNLAQQPQAFAAHSAVRKLLETRGEAALPVTLVDGAVMRRGSYPSRDELTRWTAGIEQAPSIFTEQVGELVAIGAAIASNCEPCLTFHVNRGRALGVTDADMRRAVDLAQLVKEMPARAVLDLAGRHLETKVAQPAGGAVNESPAPAAGGCCGPASGPAPSKASKCC